MKLHLRFILIVPFVLQIFAVVGLTGWLSLRNGQKAVENLVSQLQLEISDRIEQHLNYYLQKPYIVNQNVLNAINLGYLNPEKPRSMDRYFLQEIKLFAEVSVIQIANKKGEFYGINNFNEEGLIISIIDRATGYNNMNGYATDSQGKMTQKLIVSIPNFDPRRRPWYVAVATQGKSIWSDIYAFRGRSQLAITLGTPIYNQNHKLRGVVATDLVLLDINRFLSKLKIGKSGQTFILERSGLLVASSTREHPFYSTGKNQTLKRLPATKSQNQLTRLTAKFLQERFGNFNKIGRAEQLTFKRNGEQQYLQILPYKDKFGLDWLLVIVVPEKDFMAQINANTRSTILLCIAALGITIVLGIYTSRWISLPILQLIQSAEAMSHGNLDQQVSKSAMIAELNTLANAFNRMANQLKAAFTNLEQKVQERTAELEIAKQESEAANHAKTSFIANMSHELRTPLNVILGFSDLMKNNPKLSAEEQENMRIINRNGEHLLYLINQVLDLAKIESGRMTLNESNFDLYHLLDDLENIFSFKAKKQGIQLLFECAKDVPQYICTDQLKLRQVLINLLNNAIKFTTKGTVYVKVKLNISVDKLPTKSLHSPCQIIFEVSDTGLGIAPHELENLFKPFGQTSSSLQVQEGTGLGLTISRQFINLMGGKITAISGGKSFTPDLKKLTIASHEKLNYEIAALPTFNTTFIFDIKPKVIDRVEVENKSQFIRVIGLAPNQPQYRILIVDDNEYNRQLLLKILGRLDFELQQASNGQEAIEIWEEWEPHLIWMDIRMPIMDGYEATKYIKSTTKGQATTIIAITASVLEEQKAVILSSGCDNFVCKPFQEQDIFEMIAKHLEVSYIYETETLPVQALNLPTELFDLREFMTTMQKDWIVQLNKASLDADDKLLNQLFDEISENHASTIQLLRYWVNNFDFEKIIEITEPFLEQ